MRDNQGIPDGQQKWGNLPFNLLITEKFTVYTIAALAIQFWIRRPARRGESGTEPKIRLVS